MPNTASTHSDIAISSLDYAIVVLYLLGIVGIGIYAGLKSRKSKSEAGGYFLAAHALKWPGIGLALFATGLFMIGNRHEAFGRHAQFYVEFSNLSGIAKGAKVQVAGMDAGEVHVLC